MKVSGNASKPRYFEPPEGVVYHPGRQQPWTAWYRRRVIGFGVTHHDASRRYQVAKGRRHAG